MPAGPVDRLRTVALMAGQLHREPASGGKDKFAAVWSGDPGYDPRPTLQWAHKLHSWMIDFFAPPTIPPIAFSPATTAGSIRAVASPFPTASSRLGAGRERREHERHIGP